MIAGAAGRGLLLLTMMAGAPAPRAGPAPLLPAAAPAAPARLLAPGEGRTGGFRRGLTVAYAVDLAAGDYVRVAVTMEGAALRIVARSPGGAELLRVDSPDDRYGVLSACLVAPAAGRYRVEVEAQSATEAAAGTFRVALAARRPARPADRERVAAAGALAAAVERLFQGTPDDLAAALAASAGTLPAWRRLGDRGGEADACYVAGLSQMLANRHAAAEPFFRRAAALWHGLGDPGGEGKALHQLGRVRRYLGDPPAALAAFRQALALQRAARHPYSVAHTLYNLGRLQSDLGEPAAARASFAQAMAIYRARGDHAGEALILDALGGVEERAGRAAAALGSYARALALARGLGEPNLEAEAEERTGRLALRLGRVRQAVDALAAAVARYHAAHDFSNEGLARVDLGGVLIEVGEWEAARTTLEAALPRLRDPRDQVRALLLQARCAAAQDGAGEARALAARALRTSRAMAFPQGEGEALRALAFLDLGDTEASAASQANDPSGAGDAGDAVHAADAAGRARAARELARALALGERAGGPAAWAETLRGRGEVEAARGDLAAAGRSFAAALELARRAGDTTEEIRDLEAAARAAQAGGDLQAARRQVEQAIAGIESLHAQVAGDNFRVSYLAAQRQAYEMEVDLLEQLDRAAPQAGLAALAFETAERARARGMLDFLREAGLEPRRGDPALLRQEESLRLKIHVRAEERDAAEAAARGAAVAALDREIAALSATYKVVAARLAASSAERAGRPAIDRERAGSPAIDLERAGSPALWGGPLLAEVRRDVLDGDTVLLEYFLAEPRSYLWRIDRQGLSSFTLPGRRRLEALALRVHEELARPRGGPAAAARDDLATLGRLLLGPVAGRLGGRRLAVVGDGALLYVPFAALPVPAAVEETAASDGEPLIARHEVVLLPGAAVLRELRRARTTRRRAAGTVALVADPVFDRDDPRVERAVHLAAAPPAGRADPAGGAGFTELARGDPESGRFPRLPWSRREADAVAAQARGRRVLEKLDFAARRELATGGGLAGYRVVHFATHGVLDTRRPSLSGLVLSRVDQHGAPRDGFLRVDDLYRLRLGADLVVLSGCETALGKQVRGEGILGLTRAFFHAGASQVLASLWPVRDRATAELMERFYHAMLHRGLAPSAALRAAQLDLRARPQWRDPYFWAGFELAGDWQVAAP